MTLIGGDFGFSLGLGVMSIFEFSITVVPPIGRLGESLPVSPQLRPTIWSSFMSLGLTVLSV